MIIDCYEKHCDLEYPWSDGVCVECFNCSQKGISCMGEYTDTDMIKTVIIRKEFNHPPYYDCEF